MNRNGYSGIGRVTVATTSSSVTPADHLPWFPSTAAGDGSCPSVGRRSPPLHPTGTTTTAHSRRLSSRTALSLSPADSLHSVHAAAPPHLEMQSVLNSSQSSIGSLFRPPLTVADPAPRIYHSTQYGGSLYTTANTTIASFSSLYSIHGQPASHMTSGAVSPYNAFYAQYPQGYSHGCLLSPAGHYPHIDSYSAVLASMGSHAQHVSQSQLPRTFMPTHLSQYSTLSSHRTATPTTSPTSSGSIRHSPSQQALMHRHSPKAEQLRDSLSEAAVVAAVEGYGQSPHGLSTKDEKSHSTSQHMQSRQLSPLTAHNKSSGSVVKEPSIKSDLNKDMGYKLPSGKEGSLKHRILTRPSNSQINECPVSGSEQIMSAGTKGYAKSEAISPAKRSKSISEMASSDSDAGCGQSQSQGTGHAQGVPNVPMIPHLHYPPHFMKGSIIQLANGDLKRVEDLQTDDFIHSAEISADLKIDSSTVVRTDKNIERGTTILSFLVGENKVQVTVEATLEHPFFVFGQGCGFSNVFNITISDLFLCQQLAIFYYLLLCLLLLLSLSLSLSLSHLAVFYPCLFLPLSFFFQSFFFFSL
ncbi:ATXN1_1L [Acanthosepion pharaonis]|uniref:ATXN1_1L n=1 Tax=Acanthosepion pharaonis TaxID=158019 RepID=A0A812BDJ1_ACAPH|nr:ATXN1_1L [Sepia pharaonis]